MKDFAGSESSGGPGGKTEGVAADAVRALVALGYATTDAETAVRSALEHAGARGATADVIRAALAVLQTH
jgi:Holliday junction resolvasome RuvABC DNA-binding subunit